MEEYIVTAIKQNKKRQDYIDLFLNKNYFCTISKNLLIDYSLYIDKKLNKEDVLNIESNKDFDKYYQSAINLILIRPRSLYEIKTYLKKKALSTDFSKNIIDKLIEKNHVNDLEFAKWWANSRISYTKKTRTEVYYELSKKGINQTIIDQVLKEVYENFDEKDNIEEVFLKKIGYNTKLNNKVLIEGEKIQLEFKDKMKILNFLRSKGFRSDSIDFIRQKYFKS